jgi:hypothetical protein
MAPATYGAPLAATTLGRGMDRRSPVSVDPNQSASVADCHRRIMNGYTIRFALREIFEQAAIGAPATGAIQ